MRNLVFFLEEPSAQAMLEGLLPKVLPKNVHYHCVPFEGKQDLEKQLERKLRVWNTPDTFFIVLRDQDSGNCQIVKSKLLEITEKSGKSQNTLVRIACHELESWYLGDLQAVEQAIGPRSIAKRQGEAKYRNPDLLNNAAQELKKIAPNYQKVLGSRKIGVCLEPSRNQSISFQFFISGIMKLLQ